MAEELDSRIETVMAQFPESSKFSHKCAGLFSQFLPVTKKTIVSGTQTEFVQFGSSCSEKQKQ